MSNKNKSAETVLQNCSRSWEALFACLDLNIFSHVDWKNNAQLLSKLSETVNSRARQDKKAAHVFWEALHSSAVPSNLDVSGTPYWKRCLFQYIQIFKAIVEKNDIDQADLKNLTKSVGFQALVLQDKEWGVLSQISSPSFTPVQQWAEKFRRENLWMLATTSRDLYHARPDFVQTGIPLQDIKRWALSWAKHTNHSGTSPAPISHFAFSTPIEKNLLVAQLNSADRKNVLENLSADGWVQLALFPHMSSSKWLDGSDCDLSLAALHRGFAAWNKISHHAPVEREGVHSFLRSYLKRSSRHWIKTQSTNHTEVFENLLTLWEKTPIEKGECEVLYAIMKDNPQLSSPWLMANEKISSAASAVIAFITCASNDEIEHNSRAICDFALRAFDDKKCGEKMITLFNQQMFEALKNRLGDDPMRPHFAQLLWMSTLASQNKVLVQRCSRLVSLKKAQQYRDNLKVFYPPVHEDIMTRCLEKISVAKLKPDDRAFVEKTYLEYSMLSIASPTQTTKAARKM